VENHLKQYTFLICFLDNNPQVSKAGGAILNAQVADEGMNAGSRALSNMRAWCTVAQESGNTLFDLSMINPDLSPAREMLDRFIEASLKPNSHKYTTARGLKKLREAFADKYLDSFHVELRPELEVCVTLGTKDATLQVLSIARQEGRTLLLPTPTYPAMLSAADLIGDYDVQFYQAENVNQLSSSLENAFRENPGGIALLNLPGNPIGLCPSERELHLIVQAARRYGYLLLNDFVYGEMGFEASPTSLLKCCNGDYQGILEVYSMSKAYAIPGWRVAGLVGCQEVIQKVALRKSDTDYGTFIPIQVGATAGLRSSASFLSDSVSRYAERAELVSSKLLSFGCSIQPPEAGASVWARLPESYSGNAEKFVKQLILEQGVVILPGIVFGDSYSSYFRISLVQPQLVLSECLDRIGAILKSSEQECIDS